MENEIFQPGLFDEELPAEKPAEKPEAESFEGVIINKARLEEAVQNCLDGKIVKEIRGLHAKATREQPSGYEFFVWKKISPEAAKVFGADIVPEPLPEDVQETCQKIIAPEKFQEVSSQDDEDDYSGPHVPGKGYVN